MIAHDEEEQYDSSPDHHLLGLFRSVLFLLLINLSVDLTIVHSKVLKTDLNIDMFSKIAPFIRISLDINRGKIK